MSLGPISSATGSANLPGTGAASRASIASVNDQIRQDKQQLDDWTTRVSAKTTKGQADIQRLSAETPPAPRAVPTASQPPNLKPPLHPRCIQSTSGYDEPPLVTTARARNLLTIQRGRTAAPGRLPPSSCSTTDEPALAEAMPRDPKNHRASRLGFYGSVLVPRPVIRRLWHRCMERTSPLLVANPFRPSYSAPYGVALDMRGIADLRNPGPAKPIGACAERTHSRVA